MALHSIHTNTTYNWRLSPPPLETIGIYIGFPSVLQDPTVSSLDHYMAPQIASTSCRSPWGTYDTLLTLEILTRVCRRLEYRCLVC